MCRSLSKNPIKPVTVRYRGVILWSEMAHSHLLGLINLTCFASPLIFAQSIQFFVTTKSLNPISICNNLVSQPRGLLWKCQSNKITPHCPSGWRRFLLCLLSVPFSDALGYPGSLKKVCHFCAGVSWAVKSQKGAHCLKDTHVRITCLWIRE